MAQTKPINNNAEYRKVEGYIKSLLAAKGFGYLERKGSSSWVDKNIQPTDAAVRYKLCYWGHTSMSFAVRAEWAAEAGYTKVQLHCPDEFNVMPSDVEFFGLKVRDDATSRTEIERIIDMMP